MNKMGACRRPLCCVACGCSRQPTTQPICMSKPARVIARRRHVNAHPKVTGRTTQPPTHSRTDRPTDRRGGKEAMPLMRLLVSVGCAASLAAAFVPPVTGPNKGESERERGQGLRGGG